MTPQAPLKLSNVGNVETTEITWTMSDPVDGRKPAPVEVGSLSHYLQGFIHPRWLFGISSINSPDWKKVSEILIHMAYDP